MDVYKTQMSLYTSGNSVSCRVFSTSVKGGALNWFTTLPHCLVDCFITLLSMFDTQFTISRPHHLTSIALVNIRQEKGESLQTFIKRFSKLSLNIQNLSLEVAMHHLVTMLQFGSFADSLYKKPTTNLNELTFS